MADTVAGRRKRGLSPAKAHKMLEDNSAQGHPLSDKQRGYFGMIAGGGTPTHMADKKSWKGGKRWKKGY